MNIADIRAYIDDEGSDDETALRLCDEIERLQLTVAELIELKAHAAAQASQAANEIERLQAELAKETARANWFEHYADCHGGCSECTRLYAAWQEVRKGQNR